MLIPIALDIAMRSSDMLTAVRNEAPLRESTIVVVSTIVNIIVTVSSLRYFSRMNVISEVMVSVVIV